MTLAATVYTPKVLGDVDAVLFSESATEEETEDIRVWLRSLFGEDAVPTVNRMNRFSVSVQTETWFMQIPMGNYILWNGLSLQLVPRLAFELVYSQSS